MKKFISLVFVLLFLGAVNSYAEEIECPNGWELKTIRATYTYPPSFVCEVDITFCCGWDNIEKRIMIEIEQIKASTPGGNCIASIPDFSDFINWVHDQIAEQADSLCKPDYPPCDDLENPFYEVHINSKRCFKYVNKSIYGIWELLYLPCPGLSGECKTIYRICYDYRYTPPRLRRYLIGRNIVGPSDCPTTVPTLPPPGKTWNEYWETYCFLTCN